MRKVPITIMRGGTSKGVFIQANNAPFEHDELEAFLLDIMGSPNGCRSMESAAVIL